MKISKPKEYINILLEDLVSTVRKATANYIQDIYQQQSCYTNAESRFDSELEIIDKIKAEIMYIVHNIEIEDK